MLLLQLVLIFMYILASAEAIEKEIPSGVFPDDYDQQEPPFHKNKPADVYLTFNVLDIDSIDDGAMEFSIQMYVVERWKDHRLNLTSYILPKYSNVIFPITLKKNIWVPDIIFENSKSGKIFQLTVPNTSLKVLEDGKFIRTTKMNLVVSCLMNFYFYPMDTQCCYIKIASMSNPDNKVLLHWHKKGEINVVGSIQPLEYMLVDPQPYKNTEIWPSGNYTYLYANFTFIRRLSGTIFNVYIPSTLVVFLSWISFWLEVNAVPARITLGVTSLLTLSTQVVQARSGLPAISYLTALDVWLFACLITVFSSLLEFAFAYQLRVISNQRAMKIASKQATRPRIKSMIFQPRYGKESFFHGTNFYQKDTSEFEKIPDAKNVKSLDKLSRKLFPLTFLMFSVIYWCCYISLK